MTSTLLKVYTKGAEMNLFKYCLLKFLTILIKCFVNNSVLLWLDAFNAYTDAKGTKEVRGESF